MSIIKIRIGNTLYDVISYSEFMQNKDTYLRYIGTIAVSRGDGLVYPLINPNDPRPGCFVHGPIIFFRPPFGNNTAMYSEVNQINFSNAKNYGEVIKAQEQLNKSERAILTTIDNVTVPEISPNDTPAMQALKQAIIYKHIDLDKYDYRFGTDNYPNDKRLLRRDSITLPKLTAYANALDIDVTMILKDKSPDVPNPMGKTITVKINGDFNAEEDGQ